MTEDDPKKSWWHTLPGIITGLTATITALGGLVVAINQTNWYSRLDTDANRSESELSTTESSNALTAQPEQPSTAELPADAAATDILTRDTTTLMLPSVRYSALGEV